MTWKDELFKLLKEKSFFQGKITLSSGKESSYYLDCKKTSLDPYGAFLIASVLWERIQAMVKGGVSVDAVGGPTIGADPIVGSLIIYSYINGVPLSGFIVRKEPKKHGKMGLIEGDLAAGSKVIIIEDVTTTGASTMRAIKAVEELGCRVIKVFSLVDRDEGSRDALKDYDYEPIFMAKQFLENQ
ncbi:MAG: orotate phosphoribosyltransferase [Nitrospinae bacterium RIFCSPLOWO2_12_FULL_45_22]|nr:MAG: orotate phosphoribosyltransferase [Nitrospinae bacterium RIFCSPLOWO2_12_FULL_45_22]